MVDKPHGPDSPDAAADVGRAHLAVDAEQLGASVVGQRAHAKSGYVPPKLIKYGRLANLTATIGSKGKNDMNGKRKTGF